MEKFVALIPAAGSGARFGAATPKQYLPLAGHPLIVHTVEALARSEAISTVAVVLSQGDEWWGELAWPAMVQAKLRPLFCGGATRAQSVCNGLAALRPTLEDDDWVLVHDAARPCLSQEALRRLMDELKGDPVGGILAMPIADTVKRADQSGRIDQTLSRDGLWGAQTPQMFRAAILERALAVAIAVTDEASAVEALGLKPRLVEGEAANLKVTWPRDLALAELILREREL